MNTVEKMRGSRKKERDSCSKWSLMPPEAETAGQVRGCEIVNKLNSVCFPVMFPSFKPFKKPDKECVC